MKTMGKKQSNSGSRALLAACCLALASVGAHAADRTADWIVSANDGKYQRVLGVDTYLSNPPTDSLALLDASQFPPRLVRTIPVENGVQGPPQAVAITPDGTLAFVASPTRYDLSAKHLAMDTFVQIVALSGSDAGSIDKLDVGSHPQGIAVNRAGTLALVTCVDGSVHVLRIDGGKVHDDATLKLSDKRLAGVSFTHDGKHALVSLRDEQGIAVLNVANDKVSDSGDRLSSGVAPYTIDVSSDGRWAVVSDVGLAGLPNYKGRLLGDADALTLIDLSTTPFRSVQNLTVPSVPEGVAISPDGKWIAAQSIDGSNLTADNPGRHARGKVVLFAIRHGVAVKLSELPSGEAAQGLVFTRNGRYLIVQFNVERQLAFFEVRNGKLIDTGKRMPFAAGPASIRTTPR